MTTFLKRITAVLTLFALVPMLFLLGTLLRYRSSAQTTATIAKAQDDAERVAAECERLCYKVENIASALGADQTLIKTSKLFRRGATLGQEIDSYTDLNNVIALTLMNDELEKLKLYLPESKLVTRQRNTFFPLSDLTDDMLPPLMTGGRSGGGWTLSENGNPIYYYRMNYSKLSEFTLSLELTQDALRRIFEGASCEGCFELSSGGQTLFTYGEAAVGQERTLSTGGWTLRAVIPLAQYTDAGDYPFRTLIVLVCIMLIMIPILAYVISRPISRTIGALVSVNHALTRQEFTKIEEDSRITELHMLQKSHNIMVDSIQALIRNVYEAQHERDQMALNSLFEQIKPHFLYNTLEGGKWLAKREGAQKTAAFIETLSIFYRTGLSQGSLFVPLSQEFEHITEYVKLMNMRYSEPVELVIDAPEAAKDMRVLRLILQPLVENAIEHGLHGIVRRGLIRITVRLNGTVMDIEVRDNGSGLTEETCQNINNAGGYGLSNVKRRLRAYCGAESDLILRVNEDGGASAFLRMPIEPK